MIIICLVTVAGPGDEDRRRRKSKKILRRRSSGGPETFTNKDSISSRRRGSLPIEVLSSSVSGIGHNIYLRNNFSVTGHLLNPTNEVRTEILV